MFGRIAAAVVPAAKGFAKATGELAVKYVQAWVLITTVNFGAEVAGDVGAFAKRKVKEGWKYLRTPKEAPAQPQATA